MELSPSYGVARFQMTSGPHSRLPTSTASGISHCTSAIMARIKFTFEGLVHLGVFLRSVLQAQVSGID